MAACWLVAGCGSESLPLRPDATADTPAALLDGGDALAGDGGESGGPDAGGEDGGRDAGGEDGGRDAGGAPVTALGMAVIHGDVDYKASLVSLVDPASGSVVRDNCINSGSKAPQLSQALSGDVVLPSAPLPGNPLVLVDRGNAALLWLNPADCTVIRQVSVSTGFAANPYDVLAAAGKLYVTRYGSNPKPTADPADLDEGGDLLVLDEAGKLLRRIALAPHSSGGATMPPRPARGVVSGGKLYVTLDSTDFVAYGPGRVAVIDPATDTVSATIDLPRLKNCVAIAAVPGEPGLLTVSCAGPYDADQLEFSGIARIDTGVSPPLVHVLPASAFGRPISGAELAVAALPLAFAITAGDFSGSPPDQLWAFDLGGGAPRKLLDGGATPFTLAGLLFDPASQRVFVTDANAKSPRIHVFDVKDPAAAVALTSFDSDPEKGLLPRYTGLY